MNLFDRLALGLLLGMVAGLVYRFYLLEDLILEHIK